MWDRDGNLLCGEKPPAGYPDGHLKAVLVDEAGDPTNLEGCAKGRVIEITLDHEEGTLTFRLDGGPLGSNTILVDPTSGSYDDCTMSYCGYTIGSLTTGQNYTARVFAANAYGYSATSSLPEPVYEAPARPPDPPASLELLTTARTRLAARC